MVFPLGMRMNENGINTGLQIPAIIFNRFFWMTYLQDISNLYPEILATFCSEIIWATEHLVNVLSAVSCICWKHNWKIEDCVFFTRL